jgi:SanA protein
LVTVSLIAVLISILLASYMIERSTKNFVFSDFEKIPYNKVGLLLGTSKYLHSGLPNEYFLHRIEGATRIFQAKKIKYIVISGDNSKVNYNEPLDMKMELVRNGVPDSLIRLDYAGFRTYDSVIRLNRIFGQSSFTIISQEFHNKRAVYSP